jgi:hypothetical protein
MGGKRQISAVFTCLIMAALLTAGDAWCNIPPPPQTPIPPDWKPYPDELPKTSNAGGNSAKKAPSNESQSTAIGSSAATVATVGVTSESHTANTAVRELPVFWLAVLAALSFGILGAGAHLVLRQENEIEFDEPSEAAA